MLNQIIIVLTGAIAIWLTQQANENLKKYACIFGLIGQPFWFYAAYSTQQWGIFALTCFYTYAWYVGLKNGWLAPTPKSTIETHNEQKMDLRTIATQRK